MGWNRVASSIADASLGGVLYEGKKGKGKKGGPHLISHRLRRRRLVADGIVVSWAESLCCDVGPDAAAQAVYSILKETDL